ncbi:protein FAR-RED IMPAIRED RESPONSE 1-like [Citrus clementina]|uniref:protein FAR-RED IMPAIRED RESPONSE 1-like n=1 Tax=Citrus clementina TaxID=85681 RepID=UPI000CED1A5D|nr:protein FAR-RED IMPAIRED RESPONSE 1-like [Citrus x clementina]
MPGDQPKMIITDQDPAITKAISETLPNTFHRYCIWHILNKFSDKVHAIKHKDCYPDFQKCIWKSLSRDDFDRNWLEIIEKGKLRDNAWLKSVFEIRSKWVPAYVNHVFSAGMSSSQRAESCHSFFKRYVSKKNSLLDFMIRFNRALNHQRHKELNANHADVNEKPTLKLPLKMEKQMVSLYTREIFYKFQDELWDSLQHKIELVKEDAHHCVYKVVNQNEDDDVHEVLFDKTLDFASCICKKFESKGIPCKHILAYFHRKQFKYLPDQYILKRWTKSARCDKVIGDGGLEIEDCSQNSILMRRTALFQLASNVIDKAVISEEASKILMDDFENSLRKIKSVVS